MKVNYLITLFLIILIFGCGNNKLHLSFDSAIGVYASNCDKGIEILELKPDSTYVYLVKNNNKVIFKNKGRWSFVKDLDVDWDMSGIRFTNWEDRARIGYSSEEDYLKEFSKYTTEQQEYINKHKSKTTNIWFTRDVKSLKRKYILRRTIDAQEEYDFVKISSY